MEDNRPLPHSLWRALLYLLLLLLASVLVFGALGVLFFFLGGTRLRNTSAPGSAEVARVNALTYGAAAVGALLATLVMRVGIERRPFRTLGFQWDARAPVEIGAGLALGLALQTAVVGVAWVCGWAKLRLSAAPLAAAEGGLLLFLPAALVEELTMRGYLLPTLAEAWGSRVALIVTSVFFGALHLLNPGASLWAFAGTVAAGVLLGLAYLRTGRLWLPWALHAAWNWTEGSLWGLPVSGVPVPAVFETDLRGPALWTGGEFGPEAGLLGLLATIAGIAVFVRRWGGPPGAVDGVAPATFKEP
jgi:membrane protease YdiL (CAAX protease family)